MRAAIRDRLIDRIPLIGGRVYEAHETAAALVKPYVLLVQGAEAVDTDWTGYRIPFECWPCAAQTSFAEVDELAELIVSELDGQALEDPVSGRTFTIRYEGNVGADKVESEREAISRGLRFAAIGARSPAEPEEPAEDPGLTALTDWTIGLLGNEWRAYGRRWPIDVVRPSVLWRWEGVEALANTKVSTIEVRKKAVGHVMGRSYGEQAEALTLLVQGLSAAVKIPLDPIERRYLTVLAPSSDGSRDAMTEGQLSVTLSRKIERNPDQGPLMREVRFQPKT